MKRLWIGVGLLAIFLVAGILLTAAFHRIHGPLARTLEDASRQALEGDFDEALSLAREAQTHWEQYQSFTAMVADHEPIEQMDALFAQLEVYGQLGLEEEFAVLCAHLARLAAAMEESQSFTWRTLL